MKKVSIKTITGILGAAILMQCVCILPATAKAKSSVGPRKATCADIVQKAGNDAMKTYGIALEAGTLTPTVKVGTIPVGSGITYYVDATNGNDNYSGTSTSTAWKSIDKVNIVIFQPGDMILFKAGETWIAPTAPKTNGSLPVNIDEDQDGRLENFLTPHGSGTQSAYIVLGAYGTGALPKFVGGANVNTVVSFKDQEYWDISNIDVSNIDPTFDPKNTSSTTNAKLMGNLRGFQVYGQSHSDDGITPGGVLDGFNIHDTFIHDISGQVYWGGAPADRGYPGVYGNMGNDASKRTGGIVFEVWKPTTESNLTTTQKASNTMDRPITFNNINIQNNVICNTSFGGITVKQWGGNGHGVVSVGDFYIAAQDTTNETWYKRDAASEGNNYFDPGWHPHTNINIQNNYVSNSNTEYGCNTIRVQSVDGGLVEHNICVGAGTSGLELDYANDIVVQYNEVYNTRKKMGGVDNNGIDCDQQTSNCLVQYNYLYNNGDGFLLCGTNTFSTEVWRYNIIQNSGVSDNFIALYSTKGYSCLHNNLIYSTNNASILVGRPGNFKVDYSANPLYFYNNIFYSNSTTIAPVINDGTYSFYSNNSYYGPKVTAIPEDVNAITENPGFTGNFTSDIQAFNINGFSPLVNAGKEVTYPSTFGGKFTNQYMNNLDFFGNPVKSGLGTDIGVNEYQFTAGNGIIRGYVKDAYGALVAGATVKLDGTSYTATTQSSGYYSFGEIPVGLYNSIATKNMYLNGDTVMQAVKEGEVVNLNLNLGENMNSIGKISGLVTVSGGTAIANAKITMTRQGQIFETATNSLGKYLIQVPGFDSINYTLAVSKTGYLDIQKDMLVRKGDSLIQSFIMWSSVSPTRYLINENFNEYTTGTFSSNDIWNVSAAGGTITIVDDSSQPGNKYLRLNKTTTGTMAMYNKVNTNATGIVTIEAKVMRTTDSGTYNQMQMFSYNTSDFGTGGTIPPSTGRMATFALSHGATHDIFSHNTSASPGAGVYQLNKWDSIRIVTNLNTETYDFYFDDMITPSLTNQSLRTTNRSAIDKYLIYSNTTNVGDMCLDYFRVFIGTPNLANITTQTANVPDCITTMSLYPNPLSGGFYISGLKQPSLVTITDIFGRMQLQQTVGMNEFIPMNHMSPGIYIVRVENWVTKLIVK